MKPDIKFFELAAQILPTLMIAIVIEIRTSASLLFPNGLSLNRPTRDVIESLSVQQFFGICSWIGTSLVFGVSESTALLAVFYGDPGWISGFLVYSALGELVLFATLTPIAQFFVQTKAEAL